MESSRQPDADLSAFIEAQTAPLGRLARSLVGANSADDLVQDTWTSYLRRPPRDDAPAGGFLSTIARRLAWKQGRSEGRRREREQFSAPSEHTPGPAEFAERASALREVLDVVSGLREPFRSALWQRYFDDLPPREIARRSGESLATVKSRLQRGLELVRQELDRRHAGRRSAWALALAPLSAARAASIGLGITGGLFMGSVAKLSAAALAIAGCVGLLLWSNRDEVVRGSTELLVAAGPQAEAAPLAAQTAAPTQEQRSAVDTPAAAPSDPPLEIAPELAHPFLYVLVVRRWDEYGLPAAQRGLKLAPVRSKLNEASVLNEQNGATTIVWRAREPEMDVDLQYGTTGSMHGSRRLHLRAGAPHEVALLGDPQEGASMAQGLFLSERLVFRASLAVDGEFTLSQGQLDHADELRMERFPHPHGRFSDKFVSTRVIAAPAPQVELAESLLMQGAEFAISLDGVVNNRLRMSSLKLHGAPAGTSESPTTSELSVVVRDEQGEPVPGALVVLGREPGTAQHRISCDEQGVARFPAVEGGWWEARAGGQAEGLASERLFVEAPQPLAWNPRLERGARIFGRVLDAQGAPAKDLLVLFESTPQLRARPTQVRLSLETRGGEEVSERGEDSPSVAGGLRTPWVDRSTVREDGSFELSNLPAGVGRLLVVRADDAQGAAMLIEEGVLPGEHEYLLRLPETPAAIQLRVLLPRPWQDEELELRAIHEASGRGCELVAAEGGFTSMPLASGWYRVEAGAGCLGWHDLGRHFVPEGQIVRLADFAPPLPCALRVIAPAPLAESVESRRLDLVFYLRRADLDLRGIPKQLDGSESLHLPAGDYWVFWTAPDGQLRHRDFSLEAGGSFELDLRD